MNRQTKEALEMAIKAEETGNLQDLVDAVNACKEALQQEALATNKESLTVQPAETNEQEPIAWMNDIAFSMDKELLGTRSRIVGLYARPPEWKGLSDVEKTYYATYSYTSKINLIDEIERALKDKNHD
jgi:hypothetical protein